jgi:2,4-dienoyl-CoA reductase-like NADH-dependent reductase (Old Yellow Enzyme family)
LASVAELYGQAARNARLVGFDAVEIHGAHGYLLDEFLWEQTNLRTDRYGGPLSDRTRFPAEVVSAVRGSVRPDFPVIFRFSQWKAADYDASVVVGSTELQELLAPLLDARVDVFHPFARRHHAAVFPDMDPVLSLAGWTKKVTGAPVITPAPVDEVVWQFEAGECDVVALGRTLLADSAWVNRLHWTASTATTPTRP